MTVKHIDNEPMAPLPPATIVNGALACLLMFLGGSVLALGVFTVPLEQQANPPGSLNGVWSSAIGLVSFVSIPVTILTGFFLDAPMSLSFARRGGTISAWKTNRIRVLTLLICLSYASMAVIGLGVQRGSRPLIRVAVLFQSIPLGIIYLLATEVLVRWNPNRPGLAVGLGQMALGSGAIVIASVYHSLVISLGCVSTLYAAALLFALATVPPTLFLRWPDEHEAPSTSPKASEQTDLSATRSVHMEWRSLCAAPAFWLYVFVTFTSAAPQALVVFFFKLGFVYNRGSGLLLRLFQTTNVLSTTFGVVGIFLTDIAKRGRGRWFSGAKNLMTLYLAVQTAGFCGLCLLTRGDADFGPFVAVVMVLVTMMAACCGSGAVLARDVFGSANSTVVFGFGSGLGVGAGEGVGTLAMAFVEAGGFSSSSGIASAVSPASYRPFYVAAAVWSFLGLLCVARLARCDAAFERRTRAVSYGSNVAKHGGAAVTSPSSAMETLADCV